LKRQLLVVLAVLGLTLSLYPHRGPLVRWSVYARCQAEQELASRLCEPCASVAAKEPSWSPLLDEDLTRWCLRSGVAGPPINPMINPITGERW